MNVMEQIIKLWIYLKSWVYSKKEQTMKVSFNIQGPNDTPFYNNSSTYWNMGGDYALGVHEECLGLAETIDQSQPAADDDPAKYDVRITWDGGEGLRGDRRVADVAYSTALAIQGHALRAMERLRKLGLEEVEAGIRK